MTPYEIAKHLKVIEQKEFSCSRSGPHKYENIGDAIVTTDPSSASSPYPSANGNAAHYFGVRDNGVSGRSLEGSEHIERGTG